MQRLLEFETAHVEHSYIRYQAGRPLSAVACEKLFRRSIGFRRDAHFLDERRRSRTARFIVVDDINNARLVLFGFFGVG